MKVAVQVMMLLGCCLTYSQAQSMFVPTTGKPTSVPMPKYLVYRYFLGWINDLNNKAVAAHATDPYEFAKPIGRAQLTNSHLDSLLKEAKSLDIDIRQQDARAKAVITEYRQRAQKTVNAGGTLSPLPPELHQLQAERRAKLIQHMSKLQTALGPEKTAQLDEYMRREIVPHISVKSSRHPPASVTPKAQPVASKQ